MITNKLLAGTSLFFGGLGCCLLILSVIIYAFKRRDYSELVSSFKEKYEFPAPCSFFYMTGVFGVFPVLRFFIKLRQGKKMSLMDRNDPAYNFFDDKKTKIHTWMKIYSFLWFSATACYILFFIFGLLLP